MSSVPASYPTPIPASGWTCANCGGWVPNGVMHTCTWYNQPYSPPVRLTDDEIERIARRVVELLKEEN